MNNNFRGRNHTRRSYGHSYVCSRSRSPTRKISLQNTGAKHVAYADDLIGAGNIKALRKWWDNIIQHGPPLGYRPNAAKSSLIVKKEH